LVFGGVPQSEIPGRQEAGRFCSGILRAERGGSKGEKRQGRRRQGGRLFPMLELLRFAQQLRKANIRRDADVRPRKG
jgi:hypothetical protein